MFRDKKPQKRLRLGGPPPHTRSIHVKVRLEWTHNQERLSREALLLLDSGATGAVLSSDWVKDAQVPCVRRKDLTPITDASGNHIPGSGLHYTTTVDMYIGDHTNKMRFEVAYMPVGKVNPYLPISWLKDHNPDINWEKSSLKWRSEYCKAQCLRKERRIEFITEQELLAEDPDNIFVMGMALYTDEDGDDIKVKILPEYQDYADIFSQERINALPQHTKYDHRVDLVPDAKLPDGPIYPLSKKELDAL